MHVLGPQRLRRERRGDRGIDPAADADDDTAAEAVLDHVVVEPELQRATHLLQLVTERDNLAGGPVSVRRRLLGADVHDREVRRLFTLARERASAHVTQPASHDFLRIEIHDDERFLETGSTRQNVSFVVENA